MPKTPERHIDRFDLEAEAEGNAIRRTRREFYTVPSITPKKYAGQSRGQTGRVRPQEPMTV